MEPYDKCVDIEPYLEAENLRRILHLLEDWQLISRVALLIRLVIDSANAKGCNGIEVARRLVPNWLNRIGVDRRRVYRAYLHGLRDDVLEVLIEAFPYLEHIERPYNLNDGRLIPVDKALSDRSLKDATTQVKRTQMTEEKAFEQCVPQSALMELRELKATLSRLEDWQIVSRVALIIREIIDKSPCNGVEVARTYLPSLLESIGLNRLRHYRAYLHGIRDDVIRVLRDVFPFLQELKRPIPVDVTRGSNSSWQVVSSKASEVRQTKSKTKIKALGPWILVVLMLVVIIILVNSPGVFTQWFTPQVKISNLVTNPEEYVNREIEVEGILSLALFKPLYCLGGTLKSEIDVYNAYGLVDEMLEYAILITKPPDDGKRIYHFMEIGEQLYVYRFRGVWKKYKASCCTYSIAKGGITCVDFNIYALQVTAPGEVVRIKR